MTFNLDDAKILKVLYSLDDTTNMELSFKDGMVIKATPIPKSDPIREMINTSKGILEQLRMAENPQDSKLPSLSKSLKILQKLNPELEKNSCINEFKTTKPQIWAEVQRLNALEKTPSVKPNTNSQEILESLVTNIINKTDEMGSHAKNEEESCSIHRFRSAMLMFADSGCIHFNQLYEIIEKYDGEEMFQECVNDLKKFLNGYLGDGDNIISIKEDNANNGTQPTDEERKTEENGE